MRRVVAVLWVVALVGVAADASARASAGKVWSWARPFTIDRQAPFADADPLRGASCPSATECVTTAAGGRLIVTTRLGQSRQRSTPFVVDTATPGSVQPQLESVSCPAVGRCFATDNQGYLVRFVEKSDGVARWIRAPIDAGAVVGSIACPTESFCGAVDNGGYVLTSRHPDRGPWRRVLADSATETRFATVGPRLVAISCPSRSMCAALDEAGGVVTSVDPAATKPHWTLTRLAYTFALPIGIYDPAGGISCPSAVLCVIAGGTDVVTSTDPTGGAATWSVSNLGPLPGGMLTGVSCPSPSLCVAVDSHGLVHASVDPAGGTAAWNETKVSNSVGSGVACPTVNRCFIVDLAGHAFTSDDPAGGAWTARSVQSGFNALAGIVCPARSACFAWDDAGNVLSSVTPATGGSRWHAARVDATNPLLALSCPTASLCVGYDNAHHLVASADPTGGAGGWQVSAVDTANNITGLSCPSVRLCVAVDSAGNALTSSDPTAGASAWTVSYLNDTAGDYECYHYGDDCNRSSLTGLVCPSASTCLAIDQGGNVIGSGDPTGGAASWRIVDGVDPEIGVDAVQCASANFCIALLNDSSEVDSSTAPSTVGSWKAATLSDGSGVASGSCAPPALCAVSMLGGAVLVSPNAQAPPRWKSSQLEPGSPGGQQLTVTCPLASLCVALDGLGDIFSSSDPARGLSAWHKASVDQAAISTTMACPSRKRCLAVDGRGNLLIGSQGPR